MSQICVDIGFHFFWVNTLGGIAKSYGKYMCNFRGNCETFPK